MQKGELDEAVPWFEQAKKAPRYEPRHYPYLNLGRLHAARGDVAQAVEEFQGALEENPEDPIAQKFLELLRYKVN
jgi:Tfp pilus assembly protein PilF